jgi:O-succinylbenzoic acid--CoA ligase
MTETLTHVAMQKVTGKDAQKEYHALPGVTLEKDERGCLVVSDSLLGITRLVTNDQVDLVSRAAFRFLGRLDNVINTGGVKVNPEEIEDKLQRHLKNRIIIAGKEDPVLGEKLILIVELKEREKPGNLVSVIKNAALDGYERPREVYYTDFFPESAGGKVIRKKVLERIGEQAGDALRTGADG